MPLGALVTNSSLKRSIWRVSQAVCAAIARHFFRLDKKRSVTRAFKQTRCTSRPSLHCLRMESREGVYFSSPRLAFTVGTSMWKIQEDLEDFRMCVNPQRSRPRPPNKMKPTFYEGPPQPPGTVRGRFLKVKPAHRKSRIEYNTLSSSYQYGVVVS